jgi:hypothetical protein
MIVTESTMAIPISEFGSTYLDYSNEKSRFRLFNQTITAANQAAQVSNINDLLDAIDAVTLGREVERRILLLSTQISAALPTSVHAQRESKWLARYHDNAGRKFQTEIPCADLTQLATNSDFYDVTLGTFTTLQTAWAVSVVSPEDVARSTVLDSLQFVGRRL